MVNTMIGIPKDLTDSKEVPSSIFSDDDDKLTEESKSALKDAVFEFATVGNSHLEHAKETIVSEEGKKLLAKNSGAADILLGRIPAEMWLKKLEDVDFEVWDPKLLMGGKDDFWVQLRMLRHKVGFFV
jgi:hypothetical protein